MPIRLEGRVLVVAPPPDDETFGPGGTISRLAREGNEVFVLAVCVGNFTQLAGESRTDVRRAEFYNACNSLGVVDRELAWADDELHMRLDRVPLCDLVRLLESEARLGLHRVQPDILLIPSATASNQDHVAVHRAGIVAARPHMRSIVSVPRLVLGYRIVDEVWSAEPPGRLVYVDTSDDLETKATAMGEYQSQLRCDGHPRSIENTLLVDRATGVQFGTCAAEGFIGYRVLF